MIEPDTAAAVRQHVDAFNARDLGRLMDGFTDEAVWITGSTVVRGRDELTAFFGGAMAGLLPVLTIESLVADADRAASQLTEVITVDDETHTFAIAGFYELRAGRIASAKIYREGSAEVPNRDAADG